MLHLSSWMVTLPMMLIGMVGIILVIDAAEPAYQPEMIFPFTV